MEETKVTKTNSFHNGAMVNDQKKDIANWWKTLAYIQDDFIKLLAPTPRNMEVQGLYQEMMSLQRENKLLLRSLNIYRSSLEKAIECDTTDCDAFFIKNHQMLKNKYQRHINNYKALKLKV
ncbi:Hypothetical protein I595_1642 [Croceitalea dokdonensis DOKDO 023]|uniref:Uncharacterized protein n=1 Tax=Croceitalea dokdonensis DOKDO 023 TaxID=1300341 RepID=A0A0P7B1U5_9FLAO|nr:hypothetical protein [Croceitalea dokdonensis]KPM31994.1 Hypothetical protein I595_1642 [Croceitalea dokdonensis DOKDO 023]